MDVGYYKCWFVGAALPFNDGQEEMDYTLLPRIIVIKAWWAKNTMARKYAWWLVLRPAENVCVMNWQQREQRKPETNCIDYAWQLCAHSNNSTELQVKNECRKLCTSNHRVNSVFSLHLFDLFLVLYFHCALIFSTLKHTFYVLGIQKIAKERSEMNGMGTKWNRRVGQTHKRLR